MITFTDDNFYERISTLDSPVLVDFWADWCPPCLALAPIVERLSNHLVVGKVDVETNHVLNKTFKITSVPTLILFEDLKPVDRISGLYSFEQLYERYSKWL